MGDTPCSLLHGEATMSTKILRTSNATRAPPDEVELSVAQALIDLEASVADLKAELRPLQISSAREVEVKGGRKAIVIFVPVPQLKAFHKIQGRYAFATPPARKPSSLLNAQTFPSPSLPRSLPFLAPL